MCFILVKLDFIVFPNLVLKMKLIKLVFFRQWKPGQPDNWTHGHEDGEDCAGLIHNANWNDFYCTDRIGFICERASDC